MKFVLLGLEMNLNQYHNNQRYAKIQKYLNVIGDFYAE
jgi:hypothetical protein